MMTEKHLKDIINYALRNFNADYDYVLKNQVINGVTWYEYFWDDDKSKAEFMDWLRKYVKKNFKQHKNRVDSVAGLIDLCYGLKLYYK
jgi:hypothetical protein